LADPLVADRVDQVERAITAYTVERELGSGGMATVYLAHDKKHDRKIAKRRIAVDASPGFFFASRLDGVRCGVHSDAQNVRGNAQDVRKCATC
jgi:hypothetical protein